MEAMISHHCLTLCYYNGQVHATKHSCLNSCNAVRNATTCLATISSPNFENPLSLIV